MEIRCLVWACDRRGRSDAVIIDGCGSLEGAAVAWYQAWRAMNNNSTSPLRVTVEALGTGVVASYDMSVRSPIVAVEVAP